MDGRQVGDHGWLGPWRSAPASGQQPDEQDQEAQAVTGDRRQEARVRDPPQTERGDGDRDRRGTPAADRVERDEDQREGQRRGDDPRQAEVGHAVRPQAAIRGGAWVVEVEPADQRRRRLRIWLGDQAVKDAVRELVDGARREEVVVVGHDLPRRDEQAADDEGCRQQPAGPRRERREDDDPADEDRQDDAEPATPAGDENDQSDEQDRDEDQAAERGQRPDEQEQEPTASDHQAAVRPDPVGDEERCDDLGRPEHGVAGSSAGRVEGLAVLVARARDRGEVGDAGRQTEPHEDAGDEDDPQHAEDRRVRPLAHRRLRDPDAHAADEHRDQGEAATDDEPERSEAPARPEKVGRDDEGRHVAGQVHDPQRGVRRSVRRHGQPERRQRGDHDREHDRAIRRKAIHEPGLLEDRRDQDGIGDDVDQDERDDCADQVEPLATLRVGGRIRGSKDGPGPPEQARRRRPCRRHVGGPAAEWLGRDVGGGRHVDRRARSLAHRECVTRAAASAGPLRARGRPRAPGARRTPASRPCECSRRSAGIRS